MLIKLPSLFTPKSKCPPLSEVDTIYQQAISHLSINTRLEYCERLLSRIEFDLQNTKCPKEIDSYKELRTATKMELTKLLKANISLV